MSLDRKAPPLLTWTLSSSSDNALLSGYVLASYTTTTGHEHCKFVPKAFGLFPQTEPIRKEKKLTFEATNPKPMLVFEVPRPIKGDCGWTLTGFHPNILVEGVPVSFYEDFKQGLPRPVLEDRVIRFGCINESYNGWKSDKAPRHALRCYETEPRHRPAGAPAFQPSVFLDLAVTIRR